MSLVELDLNPDQRTLRNFGFIACAVFCVLGGMAFREAFVFHAGLGRAREAVGFALVAIGGASGVFSLLAPRANRSLYVALSVVTYPIGFVVSFVLLALLFFGVLAPLAAIMKLSGRDALQRRSRANQDTYWVSARRPRRVADYFRQY